MISYDINNMIQHLVSTCLNYIPELNPITLDSIPISMDVYSFIASYR
jgi:hypothetical protein